MAEIFQEDFLEKIVGVSWSSGVYVSFFYQSDYINFTFDIKTTSTQSALPKAKHVDTSTAILPQDDLPPAIFTMETFSVKPTAGSFISANTGFTIPSGAAPAKLLILVTPHKTPISAGDFLPLFVGGFSVFDIPALFPTLFVVGPSSSSDYGIDVAGSTNMNFTIRNVKKVGDSSQIQVFPTNGNTHGANGAGTSWTVRGYSILSARLGRTGDGPVYTPQGQTFPTMTDNLGNIFGRGYPFGTPPQAP